jgi:adenosine deaminase
VAAQAEVEAQSEPAKSGRDLRLLPKAELHIHLQGAMRQTTMAELAAEAGIEAPDPRIFASFADFQRNFHAAFEVTQTRPENMRRLVLTVAPHAGELASATAGIDDWLAVVAMDRALSADQSLG